MIQCNFSCQHLLSVHCTQNTPKGLSRKIRTEMSFISFHLSATGRYRTLPPWNVLILWLPRRFSHLFCYFFHFKCWRAPLFLSELSFHPSFLGFLESPTPFGECDKMHPVGRVVVYNSRILWTSWSSWWLPVGPYPQEEHLSMALTTTLVPDDAQIF